MLLSQRKKIAEVNKAIEISEQTYYRWCHKYSKLFSQSNFEKIDCCKSRIRANLLKIESRDDFHSLVKYKLRRFNNFIVEKS